MKIIIANTPAEVGQRAAETVAQVLKTTEDPVLGLATGSSPIGMYDALVGMYSRGEISFANVRSVNLDEYVGLAPDHDQSYAYFMHKHLFDRVNIRPENTHLPDGLATDAAAECARYDAQVRSMGGVDLQVLGIGNNGHIGFNEPAAAFSKGTGLVDLTDSTIDANARFFASRDEVPTQAFSMGICQIMRARKILLIALGSGKADILEKALFGDIVPGVPASILQMAGDLTVCADEAAAAVIRAKHPAFATGGEFDI